MPPSFRIQTKHVFLTYSQANNVDHNDLFTHLCGLHNPIRVRVGRELHDDGGVHYHAFIQWSKPCETRDVRFFDWAGIHPNVVSRIRDIRATYDYCGKDGNTKDLGDPPQTKTSKNDQLSNALQATTATEFLQLVKTADPGRYIFQHSNLEYFIAKHFTTEETYNLSQYTNFTLPPTLTDWIQQRFTV